MIAPIVVATLVLKSPTPTVIDALSLAPSQGAHQVDSVTQRIWNDSADGSNLEALAQVLTDSIGARMTGSRPDLAAHVWVRSVYQRQAIVAHTEAYDSLPRQWNRGLTHVDLVAPRFKTLEANIFGYSPGTQGDVEGAVLAIPDTIASQDAFAAWLPAVRGKYVLLSFARPTCRERRQWRTFASTTVRAKLEPRWEAAFQRWWRSIKQAGVPFIELPRLLERAGALGILSDSPSRDGYDHKSYDAVWSQYLAGTMHEVTDATVQRVPMLNLTCEDYALLSRLAQRGQGPRLRVNSTASFGPPVPVLHTVAELRGSAKPDEYVVLGAHLDSKDAASGATDNGTGTLAVMEAMRLLKQYYPTPRRTIVARHWSGEEEALSSNAAFTRDATALGKIQVTLGQDTGTGRTVYVTMRGPLSLSAAWSRWAARLPVGVLDTVVVRPMRDGRYDSRPAQGAGGLACAGVPAVWANAYNFEPAWDYAQKAEPVTRWDYRYGYHGNRDTYDLIVFDEVEYNAKLLAMVAYEAAEDTMFVPTWRDTRTTSLPPCSTVAPLIPTVRHPTVSPASE